MADLFGNKSPEPYSRPPAYREGDQRQMDAARAQRPGVAARPLIRGILAAEIRPGHLLRCSDPPSVVRVKEARPLPESRVERSLQGGDPRPGILIRYLFMDGPRRGETAESLLHPEDCVKLPA